MAVVPKLMLYGSFTFLLHAAYATYEYLSYRKGLGKPGGVLPIDIILEIFFSLFIGILGATLQAPELKEISWANEMKKRSVGEMDARPSFGSFNNRGRTLFNIVPTTTSSS